MSETEGRPRRSKSYRGCTPCKLARRKCTEERPACSHCIKIGVKCEYDTESLFRFQEFQYEGGNKKVTQSAKKAPTAKRKSPSSASNERATKSAKTSEKRTAPQSVAPRPILPDETSSKSVNLAVQPISDLHWPTIPSRDPFQEIFCGDGDDTSQTSSTEPSPSEASYPLIHSPAPVPTQDIPSSDLPYFTFFLEQMSNILPYVNLFPSAPSNVFSVSLQHPALRHSILSISALIADKKSDRGRVRALDHLQKSLKHLQTSLTAVEVDEGMAISIFLLAYFNVGSGEHSTARKHLQGLQLVLEQLKQNHLARNGGVPSPYAVSPLTMLIWRMAIRMDFIMSIMYGQPPIFHVIAEDQEEFHRQWITLFADRNQGPSASEWALAWFALDNTMHRACHTSAEALLLRRSNTPQQEIDTLMQSSVDALLTDHRKWRQRQVVREADEMERQGQLLATLTSSTTTNTGFPFDTILPTLQQTVPPGGTPLQFLQYPPERLTNLFYANLLNHYRSIEIYISLIPKPMWGYPDPWRFECAIDLCRTHAALGEERNFLTTGKIWGLYLAGITFGGHELYPRESQWVLDRLEDIGSYYYAASMAGMNLRMIWKRKGSYWDASSRVFEERSAQEDTGEEVS